MKRLLAILSLLLLACPDTPAQHCAPLYESYLTGISIRRHDGKVKLNVEHRINGGGGQDRFQAYVVAFFEKDEKRVPAPAPGDLLDPGAAVVLHTQVVKRTEDGVFPLGFSIDEDALAKKMIAHGKLVKKDQEVVGGWGSYKPRFRLAIFVPLLDDRKYSVLKGLPRDRHFCNYTDERAMLFQTLPYRLSIHFGIVRAWRTEEGKHAIQINGALPPRKTESSEATGEKK